MKTTTEQLNLSRTFKMLVLLSCLLLAAGCGDDAESGTGEEAEAEAFQEAVPGAELLELSLEAEGSEKTLVTGSQALTGEPSELAARAREHVGRINAAMRLTHDRLESLYAATSPEAVTMGGQSCRVWANDGTNNHWRLQVCRAQGGAGQRYQFELQGRPLDAGDDALQVVMAGRGAALPRHDGAQRGVGQVGVDFGALHALTGEGPSQGRVGLGYRAAGPYRQLVVATRDLLLEGEETAKSSLFRFHRVRGRGGLMRYSLHADFVSKDADGVVSHAADGVGELGRVTMAWRATGEARTAAVACGGSLGDGRCVRTHQCWDAAGKATFEETGDDLSMQPAWDATACPGDAALPIVDDEPPSEAELEVPAESDAELPGPVVSEPEAAPELEAAE